MAPVLLIVASEDSYVLGLNREALERLTCERQLMVVESSNHLFESGKMEYVAEMTAGWFLDHFENAGVESHH